MLYWQTVGEDGAVNNQNAIDAWDLKDAEARISIFCIVEPQLQTLLEGSNTAAEMWERLLLQFARAAQANVNLLLAKFFDYKYNKGTI